jgi:RND family efflux transporter MFP subunit
MPHKRLVWLSITVRAAISLALVIVAAVVFALLVETRPVPERRIDADNAPTVQVFEASQVDVGRQWDVFGSAGAIDSADVPARVTATVEAIPAGIIAGARVERGDLLVELDDSDFAREEEIATQSIADIDAQLAQLEVDRKTWTERVELAKELVALAQAEFERAKEALEREGARQREVDQAKQALVAAIRDETVARGELDAIPTRRTALNARRAAQEAQRKLAQQQIERCRITSPLAGVLQAVDIEVGENLPAGQRVARVVNLDRIEVPLRLPASARPSVRTGDRANLFATGDQRQSWQAEVVRIAPQDDEQTRTMTVYVELEQDPDRPEILTPGRFVRATVFSSRREPRWVVPRRSLDGDRILLVNDGHIVSRGIDVAFQVDQRFPQLGLDDQQWVVLNDELSEGDRIVITPSRALPEGLAVVPSAVNVAASNRESGS